MDAHYGGSNFGDYFAIPVLARCTETNSNWHVLGNHHTRTRMAHHHGRHFLERRNDEEPNHWRKPYRWRTVAVLCIRGAEQRHVNTSDDLGNNGGR